MKTHSLRCWFLAGLFGLAVLTSVRADEEADLIAVLQSNAGSVQKCEACKRLRIVGTARAVPALAPLLLDERIAQAARYVLETLPGPEAGAALRQALGAAPPTLRPGLADSLGWRRDTAAVAPLAALLAEGDANLAAAAATALGRIGGDEALWALLTGPGVNQTRPNQAEEVLRLNGANALQGIRMKTSPVVREALFEAVLRWADDQLAAGNRPGALAVYGALLARVQPESHRTEPESVRVAAHSGMMRAAEDGGFALIVRALEGDDATAQAAALALAANVQHPDATRTFANLLSKSPPTLQVAVIAVLQTRGDVAALPAVAAAARSVEAPVRLAALSALGTLGDALVVPLVAEAAASRDAAEQAAGRQALVSLRGAGVTTALVLALASSTPAVQLELVRALTARGETTAVPALLQLARTDTGAGRQAALQALGSLADGSQVQSLVDLLVESKSDAAREEVRRVFEALVQRAGDVGRLDVAPMVRGITTGDVFTRQALLQVGVLFADERLRAAVRAALTDGDERIRSAAARALCDARDPALLPDLLVVARQAQEAGLRSLALEGGVRLATDDGGNLAAVQRTEALTEAFGLAARVEDKRMVLAGLAQVPNRATLGLADQACADPAVRAEAEQACLQIAGKVGAAEFSAVETVLARLSTGAGSASVQDKAKALLKVLKSGWLYAGPYRQAGKEAQALFEVAFPPEQSGAREVRWRRASGSMDLSRVGEVDFSGIVGGDHCVVYAKTRVYAPAAQAVVFSIGSDDGIKLWVNGELVHANNAVRGLTPDQDRARGRLREGWNNLLVKITQHTLGCGFTFRILDEGGQGVPGLRLEPEGGSAP